MGVKGLKKVKKVTKPKIVEEVVDEEELEEEPEDEEEAEEESEEEEAAEEPESKRKKGGQHEMVKMASKVHRAIEGLTARQTRAVFRFVEAMAAHDQDEDPIPDDEDGE